MKMYDAVNVDAIPDDAKVVAGYVNGQYVTVDDLRERFPDAHVVTITVTDDELDADVADVERYDLTPAEGAVWAKRKLERGDYPVLYVAASQWDTLKDALRRHDVKVSDVGFWVADWDDDAKVPRGAVAKQYKSESYDESVISDAWAKRLGIKRTRDKDHDGDDDRNDDRDDDTPETSPVPLDNYIAGDVTRLANRLGNREHRLTDDDRERVEHLRRSVRHALDVR